MARISIVGITNDWPEGAVVLRIARLRGHPGFGEKPAGTRDMRQLLEVTRRAFVQSGRWSGRTRRSAHHSCLMETAVRRPLYGTGSDTI